MPKERATFKPLASNWLRFLLLVSCLIVFDYSVMIYRKITIPEFYIVKDNIRANVSFKEDYASGGQITFAFNSSSINNPHKGEFRYQRMMRKNLMEKIINLLYSYGTPQEKKISYWLEVEQCPLGLTSHLLVDEETLKSTASGDIIQPENGKYTLLNRWPPQMFVDFGKKFFPTREEISENFFLNPSILSMIKENYVYLGPVLADSVLLQRIIALYKEGKLPEIKLSFSVPHEIPRWWWDYMDSSLLQVAKAYQKHEAETCSLSPAECYPASQYAWDWKIREWDKQGLEIYGVYIPIGVAEKLRITPYVPEHSGWVSKEFLYMKKNVPKSFFRLMKMEEKIEILAKEKTKDGPKNTSKKGRYGVIQVL